MNRTQKKCLFAVAGMHLLLLVILIVGPAFLMPSRRDAGIQPVDFVPASTIDALMSGGGSRNGGAPQIQPPAPPPRTQPSPPVPVRAEPQQPAPKPSPAQVPVARSEPVRTAPPVTRDQDAWATVKPKPKGHQIEVNSDLVSRQPESARRPKTDNSARERQLADRRAAQALSETLNTLRSGMSGATHIDIDAGPGGGGPSYANFNSVIIGIYTRAWEQDRPAGISDGATAVASVTIARDGTVLSARIIQSSGEPQVDRSVERVLKHVTVAAPLPAGTPEEQRTVIINFTAKPEGAVG